MLFSVIFDLFSDISNKEFGVYFDPEETLPKGELQRGKHLKKGPKRKVLKENSLKK